MLLSYLLRLTVNKTYKHDLSPCRRLRSNHYKAGGTQQFNFRGKRKYLSLNKFLNILSLKFSKETSADFNLVNIIRTLSRKHAMITS